MNRIIINNKSDLPDLQSLELVKMVVATGRASNEKKQYCYLTTFHRWNKKYNVITDLRKRSDSFTIIQTK